MSKRASENVIILFEMYDCMEINCAYLLYTIVKLPILQTIPRRAI